MALTREQIAARLRQARESLGFTQAEVADALDMHRPTITEIEAGRRAVASEELYRFAQLYATSLSALLAEPVPSEDEVTHVLFRKQGLTTPQARRAVRQFMERCRSEGELEQMLGLEETADPRPSYRVPPPDTKWRAIEQGSWIAREERRRLELGPEPIRNPLDLLEKQGVRIGPLDDSNGADVDGIYFETESLGACVGVNLRKDDWTGFRAAFTAAHEYAHWLLRDLTVEEFNFGATGDENYIEVRANAFAAAFLMPQEGITAYFTSLGLVKEGQIPHLSKADIVRAMDHFGVSRQALLYRLQNLRLLAPQTAETLRNLEEFSPRDTAEALGMTLRSQRYVATRLPTLAIEAWRRGLVTAGRAADLCDTDLMTFRDLVSKLGEEPDVDAEMPLLGAAAKLG